MKSPAIVYFCPYPQRDTLGGMADPAQAVPRPSFGLDRLSDTPLRAAQSTARETSELVPERTIAKFHPFLSTRSLSFAQQRGRGTVWLQEGGSRP